MPNQRNKRPNESPMPDALAYFLTWTTYGTWLPGDERGWVKRGKGPQLAEFQTKRGAESRMTEKPCFLSEEQRKIVEQTSQRHCEIRGWDLLAVNCRSNHVHAVVAANASPETVRDQLKAWCTRKLKEQQLSARVELRENWWTERGSQRYIGDNESLQATISYVDVAQDRKDRDV